MKCTSCTGKGKVRQPSRIDPTLSFETMCHWCNGTGDIESDSERTEKARAEERLRIVLLLRKEADSLAAGEEEARKVLGHPNLALMLEGGVRELRAFAAALERGDYNEKEGTV